MVVYRKLGTDEGVMQHEWRCQPNSAQAEQLAAMIMVRTQTNRGFDRGGFGEAVCVLCLWRGAVDPLGVDG